VGELAGKIISKLGDVWQLDRHIIACADARNLTFISALLKAHFGDVKVRFNFSDLPYNVQIQGHVTGGEHREFVMASGEMSSEEFFAFLVASLKVIFETTVDGGLAMLFMDWRGLKTLLSAGEAAGFTLLNIVVWAKTNAGMGSLYRSQHEFVVVFKKGIGQHVNNIELGIHGRYRTNLWTYPGASSLGSEARAGMHDHPTPKPVALLEDAILDVTNRGDLVFDSFSGSGSTLIATNKSGRFFCGTELDPGYVDLILHRWIKLTGLVPILVASGETFDDVKARREKEAESKTAQPTNSPILSDPQKRETKEDEVTP
jgi:DNA modification methylase